MPRSPRGLAPRAPPQGDKGARREGERGARHPAAPRRGRDRGEARRGLTEVQELLHGERRGREARVEVHLLRDAARGGAAPQGAQQPHGASPVPPQPGPAAISRRARSPGPSPRPRPPPPRGREEVPAAVGVSSRPSPTQQRRGGGEGGSERRRGEGGERGWASGAARCPQAGRGAKWGSPAGRYAGTRRRSHPRGAWPRPGTCLLLGGAERLSVGQRDWDRRAGSGAHSPGGSAGDVGLGARRPRGGRRAKENRTREDLSGVGLSVCVSRCAPDRSVTKAKRVVAA